MCSRYQLLASSTCVGLECCAAKAFPQVVFALARSTQLCNPADMVAEPACETTAETKGDTESTRKNTESLIELQDMLAEQTSSLDVVCEGRAEPLWENGRVSEGSCFVQEQRDRNDSQKVIMGVQTCVRIDVNGGEMVKYDTKEFE